MNDQFGIVDNKFLCKSVGLLNPGAPVAVSEGASVGEVLSVLRAHKMGSVVVTRANGELLGIFTERDVVLKIDFQQSDALQTPVTDVMTKEPKTIEMTDSIGFALNLMSEGGYRHLPICDAGNIPVGMVSVKDIIDSIAATLTADLERFCSA